jgi:hypothetical protein
MGISIILYYPITSRRARKTKGLKTLKICY